MSDDTDGRSGGKGKGGDREGGRGKGGARGARPGGSGGARPGGSGGGDKRGARPPRARADGPAGEARPPRGDKPFRARPPKADGETRPFRARAEGARGEGARGEGRGAGGGEKRPFRSRGEGRPAEGRSSEGRPERGDRPFRERSGGERGGGEGRTFRPRGEAGEGRGERPFRAHAEGKPFRKRAEGEGGRENRGGERGDKPFVPRSRGMFSHGGARAGGAEGEKPRSYGRLSHGAVGDGKPRAFSGGGGDRPRRADARPPREDRAPRDDRAPRGEPREGGGADTMRIAKRLARAGIASRRDAEGMIADGRVTLNGRRLDTPAIDVKASDRIEIDGRPLPAIERTRLWLFHKPAGLVTTNRDPEGRPTVFDRLPDDMPRVLTIGRLDINTEGLLLLTNDGGLARTLELPSTGWMRRYRVRAHGEIKQAQLDELRNGVAVDGVFYGAIEATLDREQGSNVWLTLGLREGKNREVKRVLGHLGLEVNRLIRLSFGPFQLGELDEGAVQEIKGRTLREQLGPALIEESGADFDAPIVTPFSNKPVVAERRREGANEGADAGGERPRRTREWISASDEKPNRRKFGAAKREDALARMDTKAPRAFRARGEGGDEPRRAPRERREDAGEGMRKPFRPRSAEGEAREGADRPPRRPGPAPSKRSSNVWMAPGARAIGEKKKREREERALRGEDRPRTPFRPRPRDGEGERPRDGERPRGPRSGPGSGPRTGGPRPAGPRPGAGGRPPRGDRS